MKAWIVGLSLVVLLAGCSMTQHIVLKPDGSGTARVQVHLGPLVEQYLTDILGSLGAQAGKTGGPVLFDIAQIRRAFTELPGVRLSSLSTPSRDTLDLALSFADISSLLAARGQDENAATARSPIQFTSHDGVKTLRVELSRATWPAIASLPPLQNDPLLASLGPQGGHPYSKEEYLNLLDYAFADYASKAKVRAAVDSAMITVTVAVQGTFVSQSGGERKGDSVIYHIPLLEVVTLEKPIILTLSFR